MSDGQVLAAYIFGGWLVVSLLAAGLLVVAGLRRERAMRRHPSIVGRELQEQRLVREVEDLLRSTQ